MDDSGLREKVREVVADTVFRVAESIMSETLDKAADHIIALVDAEYRPLLEELADYKAYYSAMRDDAVEERYATVSVVLDRIEARRKAEEV